MGAVQTHMTQQLPGHLWKGSASDRHAEELLKARTTCFRLQHTFAVELETLGGLLTSFACGL